MDFIVEDFKSMKIPRISEEGFSLIELVVVIAMLSVLFLALVTTFNPATQYNKANDARREHDLGQIKQALDSYFNDTGCYPTSLVFNTSWKNGTAVYMQKIPQDPDYANGSGLAYVYQTDNSNCPQWNVLYAGLKGPVANSKSACPLTALNSCVPQDFTSAGYKYCTISGNVNCSTIATSTIGSGSSGNGGSGGSGGRGGGSPTPTAPPIVCGSGNYYGCTGDNRCNSIFPASNCTQNGGSAAFCYCDLHCNQSCAFN